jgi:hypothetical protein
LNTSEDEEALLLPAQLQEALHIHIENMRRDVKISLRDEEKRRAHSRTMKEAARSMKAVTLPSSIAPIAVR